MEPGRLPPLSSAPAVETSAVRPPDGDAASDTKLPTLAKLRWQKATRVVKIVVAFNAEAKKSYRGAFGGLHDRWALPTPLMCLREERKGTSTQDWVRRNVAMHGTFLSAVVEPSTRDLHKFCDLQGVIFIDLHNPLNGVKAPAGVFPWLIELRNGENIVLAATSSEDRRSWVAAIRRVSGAKVDDGINKYRRAESPTAERLYGEDSSGEMGGRGRHAGLLRAFEARQYHDASKYTGNLENGLWNDVGKLQHGIGDVYDGEWQHGLKHGLGSLKYACGDIYEGHFVEGKRHGTGKYYHFSTDDVQHNFRPTQHLQYGSFLPKTMKLLLNTKKRMDHYTGPWKKDKMHGTGILTENARGEPLRYHVVYEEGTLIEKINLKEMEAALLPHDLVYSQEDMVIQTGVPFAPNNVRTISGRSPFEFQVSPDLPKGIQMDETSGEITGAGEMQQQPKVYTITARNALGSTAAEVCITILEAPFESGFHEKRYDDGSVYRGEWLQRLWHGKGELLLAGGETYFGDWKEGLKHGQGTLAGNYGPMYEGEYKEGQRWGWGIGTFASGERYEGEWERDQWHGQGTLFRFDGTIAHGRWDCGVAAEVEDTPMAAASQSLSSIYTRKPLQLRSTTGWKEPFLSDVKDYELHPDLLTEMFGSEQEEECWSPAQNFLSSSTRSLHLGKSTTANSAEESTNKPAQRATGGYLFSKAIQSHIRGPARVSLLLQKTAQ